MEFDTDVHNYTEQELLDLLEINDESEVYEASRIYLDRYKNQPVLYKFYTDIRDLFDAKTLHDPELDNSKNKEKDKDKEKDKLQKYDHLKNTISRMINIDSTYREYSSTYTNSTDSYLFKLNEPIPNVVSLMLYSIEIPQSWYTFAVSKGNTVMQMVLIAQNTEQSLVNKYEYPIIQIGDGNYSGKALINTVESFIKQTNIFKNQPDTFSLSQDVYTGRCVITITKDFNMDKILLPNYDPTTPDVSLDSVMFTSCRIAFLFHSVQLKTKINYNLGWIMGFRAPFVILETIYKTVQTVDSTDYSDSIVDTGGTKYIILQLDDFKTNRLNKSVINISTKTDQVIPLPSYYNRSLPQYQTSTTTVNVSSNTLGLTEKQIYTINSISNSYNVDITEIQVSFPNISDIFAKIPIKNAVEWGRVDSNGVYNLHDNGPGKLMMEFSGPLQLATRDYFGPVDINSFSVTLYDDKGMPLGLNGLDWSFTIIAKSLIQI